MTDDVSIVHRYISALRAETAAVRALTEVMREWPVPEDRYQALQREYEEAVKERKGALLALWGKND